MDDDLDREGGVEVGLGDGCGVVVVEHLREVAVVPGVGEATPLLINVLSRDILLPVVSVFLQDGSGIQS